MKRVNFYLVLVCGGVLLGLVLFGGERLGAETAVTQTTAPGWTTPQMVSPTIPNAKRPVMKADPSQPGRLMILFVSHNSDTLARALNPYYTVSTDNGQSWSAPAAIRQSPVESKQLNFAFDNQGVAHAVWREGDSLTSLAYSNSNDWQANYRALTSLGNPGVTRPVIAAYGNNIHLAWSEADVNSPDPDRRESNIYYLRSTDRGASWPPSSTILTMSAGAESPYLVVDSNGHLHLVWQELSNVVFDPDTGQPIGVYYQVKYMRGNVTSGSVSWSSPISLSSLIQTGGIPFNAQEPRILAQGGQLVVSFTTILNPDDGYGQQSIYLMRCQANCQNLGSWTNFNGISGAALFVNIEPVNLASNLVRTISCIDVFFDGATEENIARNEQVWLQSSCTGWGAARTPITPEIVRALRPSADVLNRWTYLAYEEVTRLDDGNGNITNQNKIFFMAYESDGRLLLPIIRK
jgi:hypothetical protein